MNNAVKPNAAPVECPSASPLVVWELPPETPVSTVLRAARDLISEPERWTKWGYGFLVKPETEKEATGGNRLWSDLRHASCFCALGAIRAVTGRTIDDHPAVHALERFEGARQIHIFNDDPSTTHADVLRLFNRAIKKAEAEERLAALH